jgi:glycosyltransferase involved in cell wall biosynthesis
VNILAISLYYKPIWPGFGTRTPELFVDQLANIGNNITLFTGRVPKDKQFQTEFSEKKSTQNFGKGKIEIQRLWSPNLTHESFFSRFLVYSIFILQVYFKILFSKNFDSSLLLHPFPPFFVSILYLLKLKKIKSVIMQADLWPDNVWELKVITNKTFYNIIKKLTIKAFQLSDVVLTITDQIKNKMMNYEIDPKKINVLELAIDTDIFHPINSSKKNDQKFTVLYNGIFSPNYDFDIILNSAKNLDDDNIEIILAGDGELKNYLINRIQDQKILNVKILSPVKTTEEMISRLNEANLLILGMKNNLQGETAHPSKLFEFMSCGKPILCSCIGAPKKLIENAECGFTVEPGDYETFSQKILEMKNSVQALETFGKNGRNYVIEHHSLPQFREKLSKIFS